MNTKHIGPFVFLKSIHSTKCSSKRQHTVIIYFRSRWGEVDGYLPVLKLLKTNHPDWYFFTILGNDRLAETIHEQPLLFSELQKISDTIVHLKTKGSFRKKKNSFAKWRSKLSKVYFNKFASISWRPILKEIKKLKPQLIIKDHVDDNHFLKSLNKSFTIPSVASPHGTGIFIEREGENHRKTRDSEVDLFLVGEHNEIPWFEETLKDKKKTHVAAIGRPRYDEWWIHHLSSLESFKSSAEATLCSKAQRTFLFVTRGPSPIFFPKNVFEQIVKEVAEAVFSDSDSVMLIKPHPQQNPEELLKLLQPYDSDRWMISSLQTMQLAQLCDLSLCMVSSVILDCLAVRKPVIEYFRYTKGEHIFKKDPSGKTISNYTELGLALPADSPQILSNLIEEYFSSVTPKDKWDKQHQIAEDILRLDNKASERAVQEIAQLLNRYSSKASS